MSEAKSTEATSGMIFQAMAAVMAAVGSVGKTRKNLQQGYQFRGIDDVMAHVQPVLAEHGVVVVPEVLEREREMVPTKSGGTMASVRLLVRHTFYARDGSHVVATTLGEAMDSGDKASNKAMSAALKYAITEALLIPTYEVERDTEEDSPQIAPGPRPVAKPTPIPPKPAAPDWDTHGPVSERAKVEVRLKEATSMDDVKAISAHALKALSDADRDALRPLFNATVGRVSQAGRAA